MSVCVWGEVCGGGEEQKEVTTKIKLDKETNTSKLNTLIVPEKHHL